MKKLFSLLLTFLCLHVYAQKNPFAYRPLKGKVKSVSIKAQALLPRNDTTRFASNEQLSIVAFQYDSHMPFIFEYDSKGNMVSQNDYDFIYRRKFNNNNQLTEFVQHSKASPHKRITKKITCEYTGGLISDSTIYTYYSDKPYLSERNVFVYDKNKKLQELIIKTYRWKDTTTVYDSERKITYKYDAQSRLLEKAEYDRSGKLSSTDRYLYDNKGKKIKELYETDKERYNRYSSYVYNAQGNVIESGIYNFGNEPQIKRTFKYNADNLLIERTYDIKSSKKEKTLFSYNSKKQLLKVEEFVNDKVYYVNEFILDQKGNVLESMFYLSGNKPLVKHIHQIEYYD